MCIEDIFQNHERFVYFLFCFCFCCRCLLWSLFCPVFFCECWIFITIPEPCVCMLLSPYLLTLKVYVLSPLHVCGVYCGGQGKITVQVHDVCRLLSVTLNTPVFEL